MVKFVDFSMVKVVCVIFMQGQVEVVNIFGNYVGYVVEFIVKNDVQLGQDIWNFMYNQFGIGWMVLMMCVILIFGFCYFCMVGFGCDLVCIVLMMLFIEKLVDCFVVNFGQFMIFLFNYFVNVVSNLLMLVDDYMIVDMFFVGVIYIEGLVDFVLVVMVNGFGQQVFIWLFDGVLMNVQQVIIYQVVVDIIVVLGIVLMNLVVVFVLGVIFCLVIVQIMIVLNGYMFIGKLVDILYILNLNGDGMVEGFWMVMLWFFDLLLQIFMDMIDVFLYVGDDCGIIFLGVYELIGVDVVVGVIVYYIMVDLVMLLDDFLDGLNGIVGNVFGNMVGWIIVFILNVMVV